ncbi:tRNA dimethylallyltransferase [Syntrophobotulus glycolicus DSM 8271]|uniref:tRNA dimethylallyltransferase n=1 Tax=Syntrophobotulus glycolicus (strain DSM 8271 / FlGlyR) TaxID=645991 RepID=F0SZH7_SYNGF|nr:tRNA (adenosine(37)-N6)-dimethylallyltransferase MiaA [Syntrophobotulus glycolicus]ADY56063.1 tRNA dimethylallyltransferase [Syntrophobotulus glycolicus DSM 8271]
MLKGPLIIIVGPTAVGKSDLGMELARKLNGEIINGDSIQVYQELDIGSAKPSLGELGEIRHHLINILEPDKPFTTAVFQSLARVILADIQARRKMPIIVGGTGLYIRSLTDDYSFPLEGSDKIKTKWLTFVRNHGSLALHGKLAEIDPSTARRLHPNDTARVVRALEVSEITGKPLSEQRDYLETKYPALDQTVIYLGLDAPRQVIYDRINLRCESMLEAGLIQEVEGLLRKYPYQTKSLQSIGYRHVIQYLRGLTKYEEMLRLFQRDTRHFAKRQFTWFRRDPRIKWYDTYKYSKSEIISDVFHTCREALSRVE